MRHSLVNHFFDSTFRVLFRTPAYLIVVRALSVPAFVDSLNFEPYLLIDFFVIIDSVVNTGGFFVGVFNVMSVDSGEVSEQKLVVVALEEVGFWKFFVDFLKA